MKLNSSGETNARSHILSGDVDKNSSWSFSSGDGDKLLGPNGDDWMNYGKWHLGRDTTQTPKTKAYYGYPFGKNGKVYRSGLVSIRQRATGQNADDIFDAAGRLVEQIDGEKKADNKGDNVSVFKMNASGKSAEIYLYDVIGSDWMGGISADQFSKDLKGLGGVKNIDVRINSDGGDVFEGRTIYTLLKQHPAKVNVYIDGLAASIASLIAMAGDEITMADGAMMMIHKAWGVTIGNAEQMRKQADVLGMVDQTLLKTYCARTGMSSTKCLQMMNDETWMNPEDCVKYGFADSVAGSMKVAAKLHSLISKKDQRVVPIKDRFKKIPSNLRTNRMAASRETQILRQMFT